MTRSNRIVSLGKRLIKAGIGHFGFDVVRRKNDPLQTLIGLRSRPIRTVIDVGANAGQFAKGISAFFPTAKIYCFEPVPEAYELLSSWGKTREGRVIACNHCIGDRDGEVEMFLHEEHTPSSSLLATTELTKQYYPATKKQRRICAKQKTLDNVLDELEADLSLEIIVKLDVQGYEKHVIAGAGKTLAKASACIAEVNLDTIYHGQTEFNELLMMFENLGYHYGGVLSTQLCKFLVDGQIRTYLSYFRCPPVHLHLQ